MRSLVRIIFSQNPLLLEFIDILCLLEKNLFNKAIGILFFLATLKS